jgi:hypothetical protein
MTDEQWEALREMLLEWQCEQRVRDDEMRKALMQMMDEFR